VSSGDQPNAYFAPARNWKEARKLISFIPRELKKTAGRKLQALRIHIRDHKQRDLAVTARTLEAHYGDFVFTQSWKGEAEARRWALEVSYGREPREVEIGGRAGRMYELGPEPPADDIDGRSSAVVAWCDGEMFYFLASDRMEVGELVPIARSVYR
jgi:hypothetical protein